MDASLAIGLMCLAAAAGGLIGLLIGHKAGWNDGYTDGVASQRRRLSPEHAARSTP